MKKIFTTLVAIIAIAQISYSQNTAWSTSGNIGIGTTSPVDLLDLNGNFTLSGPAREIRFRGSDNVVKQFVWLTNTNQLGLGAGGTTTSMFVTVDGKFGIGTTTPSEKLSVIGNISAGGRLQADLGAIGTSLITTGNGSNFQVSHDGSSNLQLLNSSGGAIQFRNFNNSSTLFHIGGNGSVGIGTTNPDAAFKLSVLGPIRATEIKVETGWSDYVFDEAYKLRPIAEVEAFIKQNHHLPDVPTAAEVEKNGVNLGETSSILLKKIEELTLYLIQKDNENKRQDERIKKLEIVVKALSTSKK